MKMANNLRRIMFERGITVSVLSEKVHIPKKTLYHWLSGQRPRDFEKLLDVCEVLQIPVTDLFDRPTLEPVPSQQIIDLSQIHSEFNVGRFEVILRPLNKNKKKVKGGRV